MAACLTAGLGFSDRAGMDADPVVRAALFPMADLLPPPPDHPDRLVEIMGLRVFLGGGVPDGMVFPERIRPAQLRAVVREVRQRLRHEGCARGVWFVPEAADPADLAVRLQGLGLTPNEQPPFEPRYASMVAVEPPPSGPSDVDVNRVRTFEEFLAAQRVAANAFGVDDELRSAFEARAARLWPFHSEHGERATFVATISGEVVGFADAAFGKTAVYLRGSATHPDYRGRGIYRSMVRARWEAAVARRTPALTVGAGAQSRPILERLGFSIVGWDDCLRDDLSA